MSERNFEQFISALDAYGQAVPHMLEQLGPFVVGAVQQNITDFATPANAPLTKQIKGNKGPLKDSGELRASITYKATAETLIVGTNKIQARLLHNGGTLTPKKAKKLVIPTTREVRRWMDTKGVKGFTTMLKSKGWSIGWRPDCVIGTPPRGAKGMGVKIDLKVKAADAPKVKIKGKDKVKGKVKGKVKKNKKPRKTYVLMIRKSEVVIPERKFMTLSKEQRRGLRHTATDVIREALF